MISPPLPDPDPPAIASGTDGSERILIVTDAWFPQVNGVVRTLDTLRAHLERRGHDVHMLTPDQFDTVPCPTYPQIRLALAPRHRLAKAIMEWRPTVIHIATEGPLGWAARGVCLDRDLPFTTAFHTRFPEYVHARFWVPVDWSYALLRHFHARSRSIMVATPSIEDELTRWGFTNIRRWGRGVDTDLFRPRDKSALDGEISGPRPWFVYVGRVAIEKNIEAFLTLDLPGTRIVVGEGPQLEDLRAAYPDVVFVGEKRGDDLALHYAVADAFVFPSLTDTFGLVLLEALACGVPVAAFPVAGPKDVIGDAPVGCLSHDLQAAAMAALEGDPDACRAFALRHSWDSSVDQFLSNVHPFDASALPTVEVGGA
ncbi:glycosyltransferase family 4 protein [Rhodospira trueperi]|uniref:Glycosyltransferase involved in cell wall bisynthesis n=1 Tax=Rhodospira trueperi TaxID=69960 RepID=A0A1G6XTX5_9PROT|nr:glycosyltransferase family 1 protein [Rhodospira trueperi]SDD81431.1 Glycosyltransferase involved in cell wall bisynthesis [Rhodospira trueperi]